MRTPLLTGVLIVILIIVITSPGDVLAQRQMFIQASINSTQTDQGTTIVISGRTFDVYNVSVQTAVVSIQVNDPQGTSIQVALVYSGTKGVFQDTFLLPTNAPGGNYTAYLVADKSGYDTARLTLRITLQSPDFRIQNSLSQLTLQQGEAESMTVTVLSIRGFNQQVSLTGVNLPPGLTLQFNPPSVTPSGTSSVNITSSTDTPVGNYTIVVLAVSGSLSHNDSFLLNMVAGPNKLDMRLFAGGIGTVTIIVLIVGVIVRTRNRRRRREAALHELIKDASADSGYVATARVIARLEELRAMGKVDEATYQRLKKEYERRLERSK